VAVSTGGNLLGFAEKRKMGEGIINTGIYLFRHSLLKQFPNREPLSMEKEVFPALLDRGLLLKVQVAEAPFLDIGTPESLAQAESFIQQNRAQFYPQ
jgi:D-glycero-alpha-D-manno-heptose 1-phosphate guanylyltransferase